MIWHKCHWNGFIMKSREPARARTLTSLCLERRWQWVKTNAANAWLHCCWFQINRLFISGSLLAPAPLQVAYFVHDRLVFNMCLWLLFFPSQILSSLGEFWDKISQQVLKLILINQNCLFTFKWTLCLCKTSKFSENIFLIFGCTSSFCVLINMLMIPWQLIQWKRDSDNL